MTVTEAPEATPALPPAPGPVTLPEPRGLPPFGPPALYGDWYRLAHRNFAIGKHPFDTFVYVLTGFHMVHALVGVVLLVSMLARTTTGEFRADEHGSLTATAMFWQFANLAWVAAYAFLWVKP